MSSCAQRYTAHEAETAELEANKLRQSLQDLGPGSRCCWDMSVTLAARAKLHKQTCAGGGSSMVPEMILALSWLQLEVISNLFGCRFLGDLRGEPPSRRHLVITLSLKFQRLML